MKEKVIKKEFPLRDDLLYLNHAGVSPWPHRTSVAVQQFALENMIEGSFRYPHWLKVEKALRERIRELINAPSADDIALVKNTSEALSFVAYGLDWKEGDNVVGASEEFPSNRIVWESLASRGVEFRQARLSGPGNPEENLMALVDGRTRLIAISSVQFSTGLRMDLARIGEFCKERDILFCVDAIQSIGAVQFDVQEIQADFVMADGHKWMLAPEGLALFYCHPLRRDQLNVQEFGWHMVSDPYEFDRKDWKPAMTARRFECGSPNMTGIHALHASLSLLLEVGMRQVEKEVMERARYLFDLIHSRPNLELITVTKENRFAGIVTLRKDGVDSVRLYEELMRQGIMCACRAGGVRLSPHFYTPRDQLPRAVEAIAEYNN